MVSVTKTAQVELRSGRVESHGVSQLAVNMRCHARASARDSVEFISSSLVRALRRTRGNSASPRRLMRTVGFIQ